MNIAMAISGNAAEVVATTVNTSARNLQDVFRDCADGIYRYIVVRLGGDCGAADDICQQTCLEAVRSKRRPDNPDEYQAWLRGIAKNLIYAHWRKTKRDAGSIDGDAGHAAELLENLQFRSAPDGSMIQREQQHELLLAVTTLDAADQQLIFSCYFREQSHAMMAEELSVTEKSVELRLYRARRRLRDVLNEMANRG